MQKGGHRKGEKHHAQQGNGVEGIVVDIHPIENKDGQTPHQKTQCTSHDKLQDESQNNRPYSALTGGDEIDECDGQHIRHGVVTTALHLQCRSQILFELHLLRTEDGEYRGRVGTGHRGSQQQRGRKSERVRAKVRTAQPKDKEPG